jgi:uncharacterized protein with NAD-binding domain and iron-sulfur cluster
VIIGGGVAGLTAALHLAARGVQPLLLEAEAQPGGRLRDTAPAAFSHGGRRWEFPGEHGVHGFWAPYVNLRAMLARIGVQPAFIRSREEAWIAGDGARVRRAAVGSAIRNSFAPAPFHYLQLFARSRFLAMLDVRDILALPRIFGGLLVALAIDPLAEQHALREMSLARFTEGWSPRLRSFFAGLARNGLGAHPEDAPAAGFIAFLRFYTLMRRDAWGFSYLAHTGGSIVAALAEAARGDGCRIRPGARVEQIARSDAGWRVFTDDGQQYAARQVILAVDAPSAEQLLRTGPSTRREAEEMRFPRGVPTAIFRIWYAAQPRSGPASGIFTGDFLVDNFFWLDQLQEGYGDWRAAGGSALEMHIYGPPEVLAQPDAVLLAQARVDARRAFPELEGRVVHAILQRNAATHTLFSVGGEREHLGVTAPWPGVYACGDWVAHPAPALYLERATITGIAAANAALAAAGREEWPVLAPPEPERLAAAIAAGMRRLRRAVVRRASGPVQ